MTFAAIGYIIFLTIKDFGGLRIWNLIVMKIYNFTTPFQLSGIQDIKIIFFLPVTRYGFRPILLFVANKLAILFQFWVHTEYIKKLSYLFEYIFDSHSNHRIHYGTQDQFINKNYAAIVILCDRIFGTYHTEYKKSMYGITHKLDKPGNPFYMNFRQFIDIRKDVRRADKIRKTIFYMFVVPIAIEKDRVRLEKYSKNEKSNNNILDL